jgi:hypothetical protein
MLIIFRVNKPIFSVPSKDCYPAFPAMPILTALFFIKHKHKNKKKMLSFFIRSQEIVGSSNNISLFCITELSPFSISENGQLYSQEKKIVCVCVGLTLK